MYALSTIIKRKSTVRKAEVFVPRKQMICACKRTKPIFYACLYHIMHRTASRHGAELNMLTLTRTTNTRQRCNLCRCVRKRNKYPPKIPANLETQGLNIPLSRFNINALDIHLFRPLRLFLLLVEPAVPQSMAVTPAPSGEGVHWRV